MKSIVTCTAVLATATMLCGCFYTDDINSRPRAFISFESTLTDSIRVNQTYWLTAHGSYDPEDGTDLDYSWKLASCADPQVSPCTSAADLEALPGCNTEVCELTFEDPLHSGSFRHQPIFVTLTVTDTRGARGVFTKTIEPVNREPNKPTLISSPDNLINDDIFQNTYAVGRTFRFIAAASDPDEDALTFSWKTTPNDLAAGQHGQELELTPDQSGHWTVEVTVADGNAGTQSESFGFEAASDQGPCLQILDPDLTQGPPDGVVRIARDAPPSSRHFSAVTVLDDFDPYPFPAKFDKDSGEATFAWFLGPAGGTAARVEGQVRNELVFDPSIYAPGDRLELQVVAYDRRKLDPPDPPSNQACRQSFTWNVEVR